MIRAKSGFGPDRELLVFINFHYEKKSNRRCAATFWYRKASVL